MNHQQNAQNLMILFISLFQMLAPIAGFLLWARDSSFVNHVGNSPSNLRSVISQRCALLCVRIKYLAWLNKFRNHACGHVGATMGCVNAISAIS